MKDQVIKALEEMMHEAPAGSKIVYVYRKALLSVKQYEAPIHSIQDLLPLKGFGPAIISRLTSKITVTEPLKASERIQGVSEEPQTKIRKKRPKEYIPAYRSGGYAILLALLNGCHTSGYMSKTEIVNVGSSLCDSSFTVPEPGKPNYTSWSSMKTLIEKDLVYRYGNPPRFCLTDDGMALATRLKQASADTLQEEDLEIMDSQSSTTNAMSRLSTVEKTSAAPYRRLKELELLKETLSHPHKQPLATHSIFTAPTLPIPETSQLLTAPSTDYTLFQKGTYDIVVVIDTREMASHKGRSYFQDYLQKYNIPFCTRSNSLGDVLWIARSRIHHSEAVLDYLIERKTVDDLIQSIKDGRWKEQKFRLQQCGLKHVTYLVEGDIRGEQAKEFGLEAMYSALCSTQVQNRFFVTNPKTIEETGNYLVQMTRYLQRKLKEQDLHVYSELDKSTFHQLKQTQPYACMDYDTFQTLNAKTKQFILKDVWLRCLLCIRGLSPEKCAFLGQSYPTMYSLKKAYNQAVSQEDKEQLLKRLNGKGRQAIPLALSKKVYQLFCESLQYQN